MHIDYKKWLAEVERIKKENGFTYLTRKKCRQLYGWSWHFESGYYQMVKITFDSPARETFYTLKWMQ